MNPYFKEIKKTFGFGSMRLPEKDGSIDYDELNKMVDYFMENGFNYFDTARVYHSGMSEVALRECLVKRYPRESFVLTDKLTQKFFQSKDDIRPFFEEQLAACGVEYFDFYLMHAQNADYYKHFCRHQAYETAFALKEEGKIHHVGISFHDKADFLEQILTDYPQIEVVQIQFNYVDYEDKTIEARKCYEVCARHHKPVIVMEPVRGGALANLPAEGKAIIDRLGRTGSDASYAIRFAASFPQMMMVLSGMSSLEQMKDNVCFMKDFTPLTKEEQDALKKVRDVFVSMKMIPCTACRYCIDGCPQKINIPELFSDMNAKNLYINFNSSWNYMIHTLSHGKASDCIGCGSCESSCPQHLPIRELLTKVAEAFEG